MPAVTDSQPAFTSVSELRDLVTDEVFRAFGLSAGGWPRRWLGPLVWPATRRFAGIAAGFDQVVAEQGFPAASRWVLPQFASGVRARGVERVPADGPLVIASNHVGAYDVLAICAGLPRQDIKIVISEIPFLHRMQATAGHLIGSTHDLYDRMTTLRACVRHLQDGGALLIFPSGKLDPDPACQPGASDELDDWSPSLALLLRRVRQTQLVPTIVSHVLVPRFARHPLVKLRTGRHQRRLLAEFLQVIQQLLLARRYDLTARVSFGAPVCLEQVGAHATSAAIMAAVIEIARGLLADHNASQNWAGKLAG